MVNMVKTVNDATLDLTAELRIHGVAGSRLEARELIAFVLKIPPDELYRKRDLYIFDKDLDEIDRLKSIRLSGVPLPHIIGQWDFYGLTFEVTADTLIPRPDTETLAECGIEFLRGRTRGRLLDLCCGTGCVGISVLKNMPDEISGVLADLSEPALRVARRNLARHGVSGRASTVLLDALQPLDASLGRFQLVVCNPPYIPSGEIAGLDVEVRREPLMALDGGADGLGFYRAVARNAKSVLTAGGALMFEVGLGQSAQVMDILKRQGYEEIRCQSDLTGIERVVIGCGVRSESK